MSKTFTVRLSDAMANQILRMCKADHRRPPEAIRILLGEALGKRTVTQGLLFDEARNVPGERRFTLLHGGGGVES